ncbi:MAG: acyl-CoA dehydratase activase [Anaerovoracaceae bacterium]|jgi:predicted CoA-substrate-specific enzyme activase
MKRARDLRVGIDVGSTTAKIIVIDQDTGNVLFRNYIRHNARQKAAVLTLLREAEERFDGERVRAAVCGSGGRGLALKMDVPYIQEVVANSAAVCELFPEVRTAVELGGQDAKVVFFHTDEKTKKTRATDMRMNGSCAGGTGAFLDEIASLLDVRPEEFEDLASQGTEVYDISGRCGVFAKTDIQPLLISGAKKEDIALSACHAIVRQTIGGLAQGLELKPPIIFEGGPLTFNPTLVRAFAERLHLSESDVVLPEHPETFVALGTAIAIDQLFPETGEQERVRLSELISRLEEPDEVREDRQKTKPFFASPEEEREFTLRHDRELREVCPAQPVDGTLRVYIGIDSGSTTSKFVLMDEDGRVVDRYYANNRGEPVLVVKKGLVSIRKKYEDAGIRLEVLGLGTTGYGEKMLAAAFGADAHIVETVAHSMGCLRYYPDTTFLLDIGGQDMKAVWLSDGVIRDVMLNEACSSGCGSFLENFADGLGIPVTEIADAAFRSKNPAHLGSRCTVFMNSTIINEQREGKGPDDIMAGLCRSIIENVFTKVVRIPDPSALGGNVVVQGGTFRNRAVLRALEEYLGEEVKLAPYPGEMGAIGAALYARRVMEENGFPATSFIGFDAVETLETTTETGIVCPRCANHCSLTVMRFSTGGGWVTGNRCERGASFGTQPDAESMEDAGDAGSERPDHTQERPDRVPESPDHSTERPDRAPAKPNYAPEKPKHAPDLFRVRESLLTKEYPCTPVAPEKSGSIGIPRVLEFWDSLPFWTTFFRALGFPVVLSHKSSRRLYEQGLPFVASDTICFPAKLVHGHIMDLAEQGVSRIFFPYVMHMPPEGKDKLSPYVCSVLQGYPMVIRNSQDPEDRYGVPFDTPIFHWFREKDRRPQIVRYAVDSLSVTKKEAEEAFRQGEAALKDFRQTLQSRAQDILDQVHTDGGFAVVLAGRPYHNDPFICHDISRRFTSQGIPVLTVDSLPGLSRQDLKNTVVEITNNFHTRMLEGALAAAMDPALEYAQIVSFGCGHDAILSDEIIRILRESGGKSPLIMKVDESDASGSIGIRVQSFIESVRIRRKNAEPGEAESRIRELPDPSPAKFRKSEKKKRVLLVPNISREVSVLLAGILDREGFVPKTVPVGGPEQIALGKKYVHNDICFPCQMVIGELISALREGNYKQDEVAVGMVKFQCDCRMSHYAGLLRKGLDRSGFRDVPIVTTDINDTKDMHPGVRFLGIRSVLEAVWSVMMLDVLTDLCRKTRPYELNPGETDRVYGECVDRLGEAVRHGIGEEKKVFRDCLRRMDEIPFDRSELKPRVFVTGELLVTYHPGSNFQIERYLEANGMETVFPRIMDQLRKDFRATLVEIRDYDANIPPYPYAVDFLFDHVQGELEKMASGCRLYEPSENPKEMYKGVSDIIPETLSCGEGWLMAAEIAHYAEQGVQTFVILQPFGCLPNHICGRGVIKRLKERYPGISILPLDLDPDTSYANVENRLQMLIMNSTSGGKGQKETQEASGRDGIEPECGEESRAS